MGARFLDTCRGEVFWACLLYTSQQRIQAKYMAILDRTLLNFYAGQDIKL